MTVTVTLSSCSPASIGIASAAMAMRAFGNTGPPALPSMIVSALPTLAPAERASCRALSRAAAIAAERAASSTGSGSEMANDRPLITISSPTTPATVSSSPPAAAMSRRRTDSVFWAW